MLYAGNTYSQCPACTPVNCAAQRPTGGLCNTLPDDTAGQYYEEVISFYMPKVLTDPATLAQCSGCSSVQLRRIRVVGISGLPPGMTYSASQGGVYNVQGGDSLGCVTFCGTPVAPGVYIVVVNLLADVTARGVPVVGDVVVNDQPQSYRDTFEIFPGGGTCPGTFTIGSEPLCVTKSCDAVSVNLNATLTNSDCPNLITYDWVFGNGTSARQKTPGIKNYTSPDTFNLCLTTTFYTYRVKDVTVNITGGYSGDIEELTNAQKPDPYIRINSLAFGNRGSRSDVNSATWTNLNLVIPGGSCDDPLEIQVWDEDTGLPQGTNPLGSQDDLINTHSITPAVPNQVASLLNNSSIGVTFDTVAFSSNTECIDIIVFPHPPIPVIAIASDSICGGDSTLISVTPVSNEFQYTWFRDDTVELTSVDTTEFYGAIGGSYTVKITNLATGCAESSAPAILNVGVVPPSSINILFNGTSLFVSPFPATGFAVDWFFNGSLVPNQHTKFLNDLGDGVYTAEVYNSAYPYCRTIANSYTRTGLYDLPANISEFTVYPNPNKGRFNVKFYADAATDLTLNLMDMTGRVVFTNNIGQFDGDYSQEIATENISKGIYFLELLSGGNKITQKVVVQ
jgi:hypothetical protein